MGMEMDRMKTDEEYQLLEQQLDTRDALYHEAHDALDKAQKQNALLRDLIDHILNTYHVPRVPRIAVTLAAIDKELKQCTTT
jgi:hypothetical protein